MRRLFLLCAAALLAIPAFAQLPVEVATDQPRLLQSSDPKLAANKQLVYDFWREILVAHEMDKVTRYMAEGYRQHNPNVVTGRKGFVDYFSKLPRQPVKPTIDNLVTILAEGDLVVLAFRQELPEPSDKSRTYTTTWFDMFRVTDGLISEHWDYGTKAR